MFKSKDKSLLIYKWLLNLNETAIEVNLWKYKSDKLTDINNQISEVEGNKTDRLFNKKDLALKDLIKFTTDSEYAKKEMKKYRNKIKVKYFLRKCFLILNTILKDAFNLLSLIVWVLTGSLTYGLLASGVIMVINAMTIEYKVRRDISFLYDTEIANDYLAEFKVRAIITGSAFVEQFYFYLLILIFG